MGLKTTGATGTGKTFVTISRREGLFVRRVAEGTEGSIARVITKKDSNEEKTIYEMKYPTLDGIVSKISYEKKPFGEFIEISIDDCILQIAWNDFKIRDSFIKRIINADLSQPLEMHAFLGKDNKGREEAVLLIKQNDELIPMSFTKSNPDGIPQPTQKDVRGETKWDFTEVEDFLFGKLMDFITANFGSSDEPPVA